MWLQDQAVVKTLATTGAMNVDNMFTISFGSRTDVRDSRPMVYPGRVLTLQGTHPSALWGPSSLLDTMGCGPVPQLAPRNMESIQSLEPSSLPNADVYPKGAHKYSQLGEQAFTSIMHGLMDKVDFGSRRAVLVLDVTGPWTHLYQAFIQYQQSCKTPMMFFSAFSNVDEKDW